MTDTIILEYEDFTDGEIYTFNFEDKTYFLKKEKAIDVEKRPFIFVKRGMDDDDYF